MDEINRKVCFVNGKPVDAMYNNGAKIYGRNLLKDTENTTVSGTSTYGLMPNEDIDDLLSIFQSLEGKTITVSIDYSCSDFSSGSGRNRLGWEIQIITTQASHYYGPWAYPSTPSDSGRISSTFVVPENIIGVKAGYGYIQFSGTGTGILSRIKLEKGSVATAWTPAVEDLK